MEKDENGKSNSISFMAGGPYRQDHEAQVTFKLQKTCGQESEIQRTQTTAHPFHSPLPRSLLLLKTFRMLQLFPHIYELFIHIYSLF